jgi:hypothetical protein
MTGGQNESEKGQKPFKMAEEGIKEPSVGAIIGSRA